MINRTFKNYKFFRTYLFNSKKKENDYLCNTAEEDDNFNWFNYRQNMISLYDDKLNIIFSWRALFKALSYIFSILGLIIIFYNLIGSAIIITLSILFHIIYLIYMKKQKTKLADYHFILSVINSEIKKLYNLDMNNNS